jgi:hypothetical protein
VPEPTTPTSAHVRTDVDAKQAISPNFKLLFRCIQDVATRTRGNATGTNCNFKATTVGDVRKHQVRVHKDAVHWHTGCQSHFLGGLDDYNHHKSGCDIKVDIETDQAAKERAWRDLFRKMEPDLPFPDTPCKNFVQPLHRAMSLTVS